jgi:hypothetical protein
VTPDQTHVPLAFVGPGVSPGRVIERPVSTLDIHATVLDLLGLPPNDASQGRSLREALEDGAEPEPRPVYTEAFGHRAVVLDASMLHEDRRPAEDQRFWQQPHPATLSHFEPLGPRWFRLLPDGSTDADSPRESRLTGLLAEFADRAEQALRVVEAGSGSEADPEDLEALRALGYVR